MPSDSVSAADALSDLPEGLRVALLEEFRGIEENYLEGRWGSAELSGARFAEVVFSIIEGYAKGSLPASPKKPSNFPQACRNLESQTGLSRSFRILIPRMLPALYEVRNNRNVGHVGGEVDPDHMDSTVVMSMCAWILAELVRVLHSVSTDDATRVVEKIVEHRRPVVWKGAGVRRVLDPNLPYKEQVLVLLSASGGQALVEEVFHWVEHTNRSNFHRLLRRMHSRRLIEFTGPQGQIELLPPGKEIAFQVGAS